MKTLSLVSISLAVLTMSACTSHTVKRVNSVKAINAEQEVAQAALLDVGLVVFNPNVPEDQEPGKDNIFPQVRKAEARYIPYVIRNTLEATNQWGAVRVLPEQDPLSELMITGEIIHSDGFTLVLKIDVVDAAGKVWLQKVYEDTATQFAYRQDISYKGDPFQDLYNQLANDLYRIRSKMSMDKLDNIRTIAALKYAGSLSPESFGDHLTKNRSGQVVINCLPADNDPMFQRVNRIRETEYLFVDTVDQQYANFFRQMDPSYDQWRRYSYDEVIALDDVKRASRTRMLAGLLSIAGGAALSSKSNNRLGQIAGNAGVLGGLGILKQGYDVGKEATLHRETLKELASSFDAEVSPIVIEVEGEVVKLNGSLDAQYNEWRKLLQQIYANETGLPAPEAAPALGSSQ